MADKHALAFIFITILIDVIGLGVVIPVAPKLIAGLAHVGLSEAARYGGWLLFVYAAMQFMCAPVIGSLSDRFGRRPVLILSLAAIGMDYTITGLAPTISWLFFARALSGMAGASYTTANAYIADVTPPERRAQGFGMVVPPSGSASSWVRSSAGSWVSTVFDCLSSFRQALRAPTRSTALRSFASRSARTSAAPSNGGAPTLSARSSP